MLIHTRSVAEKVFEVWRSPGRFTKNPDMVQLPSGRLMLVYSDTDAHWSQADQILTLLASDDLAATWFKLAELARADLASGEERLVTPRLSRLADGRLVVLCDHDDGGHFHEDQPSGNWAWCSADDGATWTGPQVTGVPGFEPDRIRDLPDGRLCVGTQLMRGESQELAEAIWCSGDGGGSWYEQATVAHDGYHRFCEGAVVVLDGGRRLACVMRENHSAGIGCFVAFSADLARTWSAPQRLPFAFHRPFAAQLPDGRVLVTGRNVNGGLGTYAWCGDLGAEAGRCEIGGPRRKYAAELTPDALVIENRPDHECRYSLLPPESARSEVLFEATLRAEGPPGQPAAFLSVAGPMPRQGPAVLRISADALAFGRADADTRKPADMTAFRTVTIHHRRGILEVRLDGRPVIRQSVYRESAPLSDFHGGEPARRTQFGQMGEAGRSCWKRVSYSVKNPALEDFEWSWSAGSGDWPDEYQRRRLIQIHANHPDQKPWPDHGYSSWVALDHGRIFLVDYTNCGDEPNRSHLVGVYLEPEDIE